MTQIDLANACGVTQGMISGYENGTLPTLPIAHRIAAALGVNIETIWPANEINTDSAA